MKAKFISRLLVLWRVSGQPNAKSRLYQFFEALWLAGTREFSPGEYWVYGLHLRHSNRQLPKTYLASKVYFQEVLPALNNRKVVSFLENKWLFFLHFKQNSIRTPHCYGIYHQNSGFLSGGTTLDENGLVSFIKDNNISEFIAKPIAGTNGRDIFRVTVSQSQGVPTLYLKDMKFDPSAFLRYLTNKIKKSQNCGFLIQEFVSQHETLGALSPSASMNIRIVTIMRPNGEVKVTSASTRIGRVGSVVSNAGSGGLLAKVEKDSGTISKCRSSAYIDADELEHHPDTKVRIIGARIPFWEEAVELCLRAARLIPDAYSVGWDVLISQNGPILLEGNHDWDVISEQLFGEGFLDDTNSKLLAEHGINLTKSNSLSFRPRKIFQFIR